MFHSNLGAWHKHCAVIPEFNRSYVWVDLCRPSTESIMGQRTRRIRFILLLLRGQQTNKIEMTGSFFLLFGFLVGSVCADLEERIAILGNSEFIFVNESLTFAEAKHACEDRRATLARISSLEEFDFVGESFRAFGFDLDNMWIGNSLSSHRSL